MKTSRWAVAVLVGVSLVVSACSGGGGSAGDDPTEGDLIDGERLVSFSGAGGTKLAGTLGVPDNARNAPGVLIVPGVGPTTDRDGIQDATQGDQLYKDISAAFNAAGMVTLRYDRRGIGASKLESGTRPRYEDMVEDARGALNFLAQRREVGSAPVAVVGHDVGGWMALRLAATEEKVKGVVLVSTPARRLVDVHAASFGASHGPVSADRFRAAVDTLLSTGSVPGPTEVAPEHQSVLGQGQDELLRGVFTADPLADAGRVKVPVLVTAGTLGTGVLPPDADRMAQAIGPSAQVAIFDLGPTLRDLPPDPGSIRFDPNDESTHVFGARPVIGINRDVPAVEKVTSFLTGTLRAAKA
ncbi:MAG TPA: alpha/beta fold hydrolase [Acidimicrobiales bacterium]|nr:alpha/beta fold hydrolase [Acidimicrobiales bacterium]